MFLLMSLLAPSWTICSGDHVLGWGSDSVKADVKMIYCSFRDLQELIRDDGGKIRKSMQEPDLIF